MGKKSIIFNKYIRKAEFLVIVAAAFAIYFFLNDETENKPVQTENEYSAERKKEPENHPETIEAVSVYFDEEIFGIVMKMIKNAEKSVYAATYTYAENEITELLEIKNRNGIKVKVAAGRNKDKSQPAYDFTVVKMPGGIYHPKFFVFDSRDVMILSANISSETSAFNNAVLFRNAPEAAKILESEIDDVFEGKILKRCENGCLTEIGKIFFNPGKGCVNVRNEFLTAKNSIKAGIYTVTNKNPVVTGLKKAIGKGVKTSIIVDNWRGEDGKIVNKKAFSYLESLGADLKYDEKSMENRRIFHHKFAVIDGMTAVFGSMNWTSSACYRNREIIVISKNPEITASFAGYIDSFR